MEKGTVFDKLRVLKDGIKQKIGEIKERDFYYTCSRLATWHYPEKRTKNMQLSKEDAEVYEYFLKNKYNPSTVYKWLLATTKSDIIQKRLAEGQISMKDAISKNTPYRKLTQTEVELMYQIKLSIQKYILR